MSVLANALLISLFCLGLFAVSEPGKILHGYRAWLSAQRWLGSMRKPLGTCVVCMSSFWGFVWLFSNSYALGQPIAWTLLPAWILSIVGAAYLNYLGWSLLNLINEHFALLVIQNKVQQHIHSQLLTS